MLRKQKAGAEWFISQAVYDPEPTIRLLKDYAASCREQGIIPKKVILTFAPVSRPKTMNFIKWLGVRVPEETEKQILEADKPVDESVDLLCGMLQEILRECAGIGVPLGISCESVSIYKKEIDAVHELFRRLQDILLTSRGTPWVVQWIEVLPPPPSPAAAAASALQIATNGNKLLVAPAAADQPTELSSDKSSSDIKMALLGAVIGAALVTIGSIFGSSGELFTVKINLNGPRRCSSGSS